MGKSRAGAAVVPPSKKKAGRLDYSLADDFKEETKKAGLFATLLFVVTVCIYIATSYPTAPPGDSGELCHAACSGAIAHPPGYPAFLLLSRLSRRALPFGSQAFRVTLVSCFCGALSAAFLLLFCQRWYAHRGIRESASMALIPAGLVAFGPLFWLYHIQAEVFSMNNALIALQLYVAHLFREACMTSAMSVDGAALEKGRAAVRRYGCLGAFLVGIGLSNQHAIIFYSFPIVVYVLCLDAISQAQLIRPEVFGRLIICGLCGLAPYAYLPYAAFRPAIGSWGDQRTVGGLLTHMFRREYGTFTLYSGTDAEQSNMLFALHAYAQSLAENSLYIGMVPAATGVWVCLSQFRSDSFGGLLSGMMLFYWVTFNSLANLPISDPLFLGVQMRFWMQAHLICACLSVPGGQAIFEWLRLESHSLIAGKKIIAASAVVALQAALHYSALDQSQNDFLGKYAEAALSNLPEGALVLSKGDNLVNLMRYKQVCEGKRIDVRIVDQSMMTFDWFVPVQGPLLPGVVFPGGKLHMKAARGRKDASSYTLEVFLAANVEEAEKGSNGGVFVCGGWHEQHQVAKSAFKGPKGFRVIPHGLCEKVVRSKQFKTVDIEGLIAANAVLGIGGETEGIIVPSLWDKLHKYDSLTWESSVHLHCMQGKQRYGHFLVMWAQDNNDPEPVLALAVKALEEALGEWPVEDETKAALCYRTLAIAQSRLQNTRREKRPDCNAGHVISNMQRYVELEKVLDVSQERQIIQIFSNHPNEAIDLRLEDA